MNGESDVARILKSRMGSMEGSMNTSQLPFEPTQTVVVVNGTVDVLGMLETALDAGRYDMVFLDASDHAYSRIKRARPSLVVLCTRIEDRDGFQLLTMLKLDPATKDIPVLTYTTEYEGQDLDTDTASVEDDSTFVTPPARPRMN
jgi:CheY-like chemotaxis protein